MTRFVLLTGCKVAIQKAEPIQLLMAEQTQGMLRYQTTVLLRVGIGFCPVKMNGTSLLIIKEVVQMQVTGNMPHKARNLLYRRHLKETTLKEDLSIMQI